MSMIPKTVLPARPTVTRAHSEYTFTVVPSELVPVLELLDPNVEPIPSTMLTSVVNPQAAAVVHSGTYFVEK